MAGRIERQQDAVGNWEERAERESIAFLLALGHESRKLGFHALRHTAGAWAAIGGASPKAIQTLMRHSSITLTLDTYGHLLPDEAAQTVHLMPDTEPDQTRLQPKSRRPQPATQRQREPGRLKATVGEGKEDRTLIPGKDRRFQVRAKGVEPLTS